ncbi:homeobox-leucine zipper protein HDG11 [Tanacetum coccineum]|uniref:Homeobox-leucine zipper protein HDG11 n=1 Tax=Tanacetum coccineum TaxID=301880 RepID=A0ABQ4YVZ7_9ASTR
MEYGGGSGGADSSDKKKRYHRHTALQIQILESTYKECQHPDDKTRMQLSRELGLAPRQIKFWFQNRRTQMKAQHERADNFALRSENDKIRCENIVIREALKNLVCPTCGGPPIGDDCYFDEQKLRFENAQLKEELWWWLGGAAFFCKRKNCYHRLTALQIQILESELKNLVCPTCGGPPIGDDCYFDEQKLRFENAQLKEELDRVSSIAAKYIGRPMLQLPPVQPVHMSSLDLSMASYGGGTSNRMMMMMNSGPSLDLDLLTGSAIGASSSMINPDPPFQAPMHLSDMDKSVMTDIARNAMDELIRLLQTDEPLWTKGHMDGMEILNIDNYKRLFSRHNDTLKNPNVRTEASKASGVVMMNSLQLVDMFVDSIKWVELFPTIVMELNCFSTIVMYEELQVLSPLVPTRQLYLLRFVQQIEQGSWAVVNVSYDLPQYNPYAQSRFKVHRLPSGCFIQDMPNGYSKVTWVEHMEVEEVALIDTLYRDFIHSGLAFGAKRWLASLQRACERTSLMKTNMSHDIGGGIPSPEGKRSMMKLSKRMVNNFCSSIYPSNGHQWTSQSGMNEFEIRATLHKSTDPGQPNGMVLSASTTIWLPVTPQNVFDFLRDGRTRPQWDVLSNQNPVQEVAHISNGTHPGNCISVLRAYTPSQNNMLILQESCTDASGSLVVYCPVDLPAINIAMNGEDPSYIPLLPSGFIITTDGHNEMIKSEFGNTSGASTSKTTTDSTSEHGTASTGSLVTVVFQIQISSLPSAKMSPESLATVNNLITNTVHQIKASFNGCSTST